MYRMKQKNYFLIIWLIIFYSYFFQKFLENNIKIVKISNLPINIVIAKIHFAISFMEAKLPFGPIFSPIPGPTFEIADADADKAVKKSKSNRVNETAVHIKSKTYIKKKLMIDV